MNDRKITDEPNQNGQEFKENLRGSFETICQDFKENCNNGQLTFKEFEADVMDSSLMHDSSYRIQSSQEDEAFVSAVEDFTEGSADVTLTGNESFSQYFSWSHNSHYFVVVLLIGFESEKEVRNAE